MSEEKPCYREKDLLWDDAATGLPSWWCVNDHTGCLHNDGHNTCTHEGEGSSPRRPSASRSRGSLEDKVTAEEIRNFAGRIKDMAVTGDPHVLAALRDLRHEVLDAERIGWVQKRDQRNKEDQFSGGIPRG